MECCQPNDKLANCAPCMPRIDLNFQSGAEAMGDLLKYLFSPEPSDRRRPQPEAVRPRWMGSVKALMWGLISILIGTVLAIYCS